MKSTISKYWPAGVWKYLRPRNIVVGVVDCCRLVWNSIFRLPDNFTDNVPVAYGDNYRIITVPLSDITNTRNIVGVGVDLTEDFPYTLLNAPPDIIRFSDAVSSIGAVLYSDFVCDSSSRYYFKKHPSTYGIVNTKDGSMCTFIVSQATNNLSDDAKYSGCGNYILNSKVESQLKAQEASNGGSTKLLMLAAGVDAADTDATVVKSWREGGMWLCKMSDGSVLRDAQATKSPAIGAEVARGATPTMDVFSTELVYPGADGKLLPVGYADTLNMKYYPQLSALLELPHSEYEVSKSIIAQMLSQRGYLSVCTNNGPYIVQRLVANRTTIPSTTTLLQSTYATAKTRLSEDKNYVVYSFYTQSNNISPTIYPDIIVREAVLNNTDNCSIIRSEVRLTSENTASSIVTQGDIWGIRPTTGTYLVGILLAESVDRDYSNDTIMEYIALQPVRLHAGACVITHLGN